MPHKIVEFELIKFKLNLLFIENVMVEYTWAAIWCIQTGSVMPKLRFVSIHAAYDAMNDTQSGAIFVIYFELHHWCGQSFKQASDKIAIECNFECTQYETDTIFSAKKIHHISIRFLHFILSKYCCTLSAVIFTFCINLIYVCHVWYSGMSESNSFCDIWIKMKKNQKIAFDIVVNMCIVWQ